MHITCVISSPPPPPPACMLKAYKPHKSYLSTLQGFDIQLGYHSVFPNHQGLVQNLDIKLSHMDGIKVVVCHIQHILETQTGCENSMGE